GGSAGDARLDAARSESGVERTSLHAFLLLKRADGDSSAGHRKGRNRMADKVPPRIPAGMRDILPEPMLKRQYVLDIVREVFEVFGFEPLQTSAVELSETLLGKYGPDAERLIYRAWYGDEPGGEFAL